LPKPQKMLIR